MKILFIENRYKTHFWSALAQELKFSGIEVEFLVQNNHFKVDGFKNWVIAYPTKTDFLVTEVNEAFGFIVNSDRNINYFSANSDHYTFYSKNISAILTQSKPDLVVGESTLFHELLVIKACREQRISYLNPSSSSYPKGRFSLYQYDTKTPFQGSGENLSDQECDDLIEAIAQRQLKPDYMASVGVKKPRSKQRYPIPGSWRDRLTLLQAYFLGERYNTPSPLKKWRYDRGLVALKQSWNRLAAACQSRMVDKKIVLYPLQMQPEANLDVWGQKYRHQERLVQELAEALPEDYVLVVKANPKVKYELNAELLQIIEASDRIVPLDLQAEMGDIFSQAKLIVTVTGTVAIEAVLSDKPLALLAESVVSESLGVDCLDHPSDIREVLKRLESNGFILADQEAKRALVRRLLSSSYAGLISDPCHAPHCLDKENIVQVSQVLRAALRTTL